MVCINKTNLVIKEVAKVKLWLKVFKNYELNSEISKRNEFGTRLVQKQV
jgi:hypothetical protein